MKITEHFGPAGFRYLGTVVLFLAAMTLKVTLVDKPWEYDVSIATYVLSNIIVIPIIWYAGYFWRQAESYRNTPQ